MSEYSEVLLQIAAGIGLAACAGLRAFLPLFATGVAVRMEWVPVRESLDWLGSWPALVVFGTAVVVEVLSDKVPFVDHALDSVQVFVKPVAGALLAAAVLTDLTPLQATVLGVAAGGAAAGTLHVAKAKLRMASTLFTGGLANPVLSLAEDVLAAIGVVLSVVFPLLALAAVAIGVAILALLVLLWRRRTIQPTA